MYYKIINDRRVFSDCISLYIKSEDRWVGKPTEEQIFAEGWQVWVPPVVPPQPQTEPYEEEIVEAVKRMLAPSVEELTDKEALEVAALFATWASKIGQSVTAGEKPDRLWYDGKLYKVIQAHTVQQEWTPDITPALYTEVSVEEFPAWRQPLGSEDAYRLGDKVSHNDHHWRSNIDYNTYEPGVYGWDQLD